ncbi:hypothetical protein BaRGS_00037036 [Batillaria attramentaria]|uniref:Deoxynucleoside kinase domain-containing protein n=1 Tax=Batillaria attramentaria TaxID=370345 RepID=A0ABD0J9Z6_9CAEN
MYMQHFLKYAQALEHLLNTGQGVVMERGVYSHTVFYNVLRKVGQLSPEAFRYLNFVYDNTICEMWRPHLVIYLDAPVDYVRKQITRRANLWEVGSPIITDEFLKLVETTYKEKYLPQMRKYSDVMTVDMVDLPDWDMLIEDLEKRDLDTQPFDEDDKFKDWQSEFEDDFNRMRMDLAKKWQVENRFSMALPYDAARTHCPHRRLSHLQENRRRTSRSEVTPPPWLQPRQVQRDAQVVTPLVNF